MKINKNNLQIITLVITAFAIITTMISMLYSTSSNQLENNAVILSLAAGLVFITIGVYAFLIITRTKPKKYIYISYSRADKDIVQKIAIVLLYLFNLDHLNNGIINSIKMENDDSIMIDNVDSSIIIQRLLNELAIHEDRLQTCERVCTEYGRRCCGRVGVAVRIAVRMFNTVTNLPSTLDPVFRGVQVLPLTVRIVFEIVESGVGLGFDGDGITGIRGCCLRRNERKQRDEAQRKCQEFQESSLHISSFL